LQSDLPLDCVTRGRLLKGHYSAEGRQIVWRRRLRGLQCLKPFQHWGIARVQYNHGEMEINRATHGSLGCMLMTLNWSRITLVSRRARNMRVICSEPKSVSGWENETARSCFYDGSAARGSTAWLDLPIMIIRRSRIAHGQIGKGLELIE
jgi:hypothetical protein